MQKHKRLRLPSYDHILCFSLGVQPNLSMERQALFFSSWHAIFTCSLLWRLHRTKATHHKNSSNLSFYTCRAATYIWALCKINYALTYKSSKALLLYVYTTQHVQQKLADTLCFTVIALQGHKKSTINCVCKTFLEIYGGKMGSKILLECFTITLTGDKTLGVGEYL